MLSTSHAFRRALSESSRMLPRATLTFADGTSVELAGADFVSGGLSVTEASSTMESFDVGAAVIGTCDVTLANYDRRFNGYDFTGATIVPYVGIELDGTTEWLRRGTYRVEQPDSYGATIGLHCIDNLSALAAVKYSEAQTVYPATLRQIVSDICRACGVATLSASFPNDLHLVVARPSEESLTCLDMIGYAAQVAGCFVDCDPYGRIRVRWYDTAAFESEDWLDGGSYATEATPYSDGDVADGGGFMTGGDSADGGSFSTHRYAVIHAIASLTVSTDDVVITGVRVKAANEVNEDGTVGRQGETSLYGSEGYVLAIESNPLVTYGTAQAVAAQVGQACVGMRFRKLEVTAMGDPSIEAGDPMLVIDAQQVAYRAYVTSLTWKLGGHEALSCGAETPARNSARRASDVTRAIMEARRQIREEVSARRIAMQGLAEQIATSSGLFETDEAQQDGSTIRYFHDKETLAESRIVWKFTANAFAFSSDGGETYPYGIDVTGTAILDRVYAIGLDADNITAGTIRDRQGRYAWDLDTGTFDALDTLNACVRTYGSGVLVCRRGNSIGALVNADGSFDIVSVSWSGSGVPSASGILFKASANGVVLYDGGEVASFSGSGAIIGKKMALGMSEATRLELTSDTVRVIRNTSNDQGASYVTSYPMVVTASTGTLRLANANGYLQLYPAHDSMGWSYGEGMGVQYSAPPLDFVEIMTSAYIDATTGKMAPRINEYGAEFYRVFAQHGLFKMLFIDKLPVGRGSTYTGNVARSSDIDSSGTFAVHVTATWYRLQISGVKLKAALANGSSVSLGTLPSGAWGGGSTFTPSAYSTTTFPVSVGGKYGFFVTISANTITLNNASGASAAAGAVITGTCTYT